MAGWAKRAMGAVVAALVMGCSGGGGGGGGSGDEPRPYELGTLSGDGAPDCDVSAWCPDGSILQVTSTASDSVCFAPGSASDVGSIQQVACIAANAAADVAAADDGCIEREVVDAALTWAAVVGSAPSYTVQGGAGADAWTVGCEAGRRWATGLIHDGVSEIFDADGNLTESTSL